MNIVLIVGLKKFFELSDVVYTQVVYITYNMSNQYRLYVHQQYLLYSALDNFRDRSRLSYEASGRNNQVLISHSIKTFNC